MSTKPGRHYAYADVTVEEHAMLVRLAKAEGLSISNFVRRCVNAYLLEGDEDAPLLEERRIGRGRRKLAHEQKGA